MLYNYNVTNVEGRKMGVISLDKDVIPKIIMGGGKFYLEGSYIPGGDAFSFVVVPVEAHPELEVQTRDEDGALRFHKTVKAAMDSAKEDQKIWKISWSDISTGERVRLVRKRLIDPLQGFDINNSYEPVWVYEPISLSGPVTWDEDGER